MFTKKEVKMLEENGWDHVYDCEYECFMKDRWTLTKSEEYVEDTIDSFESGARICIMNEYDGTEKFDLFECEGCGEWLLKSVEQCLKVVYEEDHPEFDDE